MQVFVWYFILFAENMRGFCTIFISIVALFATQILPDFECCNTESFTPYGDAIEEILRIENNASEYHSSVYYIDIISEIERMGDFIINISEALQPKR